VGEDIRTSDFVMNRWEIVSEAVIKGTVIAQRCTHTITLNCLPSCSIFRYADDGIGCGKGKGTIYANHANDSPSGGGNWAMKAVTNKKIVQNTDSRDGAM
jgi:hypothetical protein